MNNQKQILSAVNLFAGDNEKCYPDSVAYVEYSGDWNWYDPRTMTSWNSTQMHPHSAMGEYLGAYISDASLMACPKSPSKFKYLQEVWDAGDQWNNPDTPFDVFAMRGSYCFYWNYVGWLDGGRIFRGPRGPWSGGKRESKLMMSCYLGYGHRREPQAYGSCEKMDGAKVVEETTIESSWWSGEAEKLSDLKIRLSAGYIDGHIGNYKPSDAEAMKVIMDRENNEPYEDGVGPGDFYIPKDAMY